MENKQRYASVSILAYFKTLDFQKCLVIASPTSYKKLDKPAQMLLNEAHMWMTDAPQITFDTILSLDKVSEPCTIIGLGGGTAIDLAKYLGYHKGCEVVAIPSMLSTNAFATNKVAVIHQGKKRTEMGVLPKEVIFDAAYLDKSSKENLYGLADVFSIYTALRDWKLAHDQINEPMPTKFYTAAENLLKKAYKAENTPLDILPLVVEAGHITNDYGSGRPESGGEHIVASQIEMDYLSEHNKVFPHGLAVSLGILLITYFHHLQSQDYSLEVDIPFEKLGILSELNKYEFSFDYLWDLCHRLKARPDKYTVVDLIQSGILVGEPSELKEFLIQHGLKLK